jgi:UDP-glucose 4-epimerase
MASNKPLRRAPRKKKAASGRVVAVTGAFGFFGRRLIRRLEEDPAVERIVAVDVRSPVELAERENEPTDPAAYLEAHSRLSAHQLDLTGPGADRELADILVAEEASALVHLAYLSNPTHARELAHELETIGTMYALNAARAARLPQLLFLSTTMCYGAAHDNPAWITEAHPLRGPAHSRFIRDKIDAEQQVQRFGAENPDVNWAIARMGVVLGENIRSFWARYFARPVVPTVLGYDPLFQVLHSDDATRGLHALLSADARGAFNLVGRGVLPLGRVIRGLGKAHIPLPAFFGEGMLSALWNLQVAEMPPAFVDYLRWSWVCEGRRLADEVGFVPTRSTAEVVAALGRSPLPAPLEEAA